MKLSPDDIHVEAITQQIEMSFDLQFGEGNYELETSDVQNSTINGIPVAIISYNTSVAGIDNMSQTQCFYFADDATYIVTFSDIGGNFTDELQASLESFKAM